MLIVSRSRCRARVKPGGDEVEAGQQQEQAKAEIEKWQESISSLEDLKEEKLKEDEDVVLQWQERATELEAVVKDLETQLNEQEEEANNVIAMWQESCNTLEATNQELAQSSEKLEEQLESSKAAASSAAELLKTTEVDKKELQERVNELETASRGLEAKLSDEDEKAKSLIADWQEKVASLQAAKDEVTVALTTAKDNQQSMEQELASLQSQMKETEGELTVARESLSEKEAMVASLEGRLQAMIESQDLDASEKDRELDSLRGQVSTLQLELDKTEASLKEAQANLAHNEKAVSEWEKRANEFETSVKELEEQLTEQENEARNAISDWSDRVQLLEKEKGDLAQSLAAALNRSKELTDENKSSASSASQLADAKAALEEKQLVVEDLNEQVAELESMVNGLQQRLFVNEKEVSDKKEQVAELESMVNGLQQRLFLTEKEASARREELEESASQVAMFESMVNGLQHQLLTSEKDSTAKRDQLQESITNYKRQAEDLDRELQEARAKIEQLEATDTAKPSEDKVEARPSEALADELEDVSLSHDDELPSPTGQTEGGADPKDDGEVAELKSLVQELEEQIKAKDSEMAGEVREWQGHCVALETQINDLSKELEKVSKALARAREDRSNDPDYEGSVEQQIAELESTIESLEQELEDKHIEAENAIAEWQDSYGVLGAKNGELEEQLAALNIQVQDLRDTKQAVDAELDQYKSLQTQASEEAGKLKAELEAASDADASEKPAADGEAALELKSKIANLEATLAEREQELSDRPKESALQELEARCAAQGEKISLLNTHLEETIKDRDEAVAKLKSAEKLSSATADFSQESERLTEKIAELETLVEDLKKERDTSVAAMEESSRQLVQKSEEDEAAVAQWNERIKQLESELERQETEANEAIAGWESSYSMVQESLTGAQAELETCKAELVDLLKAQVSSLDEILVKYDDEYAADELSNDLSDVDALRTKCRERLNLIETFVSSQDGDIKTLFIEMESLRTQIQEMEGDVQAGASVELLRSQLADANKKTAEKQSSLEELKRSLASEQGKTTQLKSASTELETKVTALEASVEAEIAAKEALEAKAFELESVITKEQLLKGELEAKLASLEGAVKDEQLAKGLLQEELQAKVSELEFALNKEQLAKGGLEGELEAKVAALESAVKDEQLAKASLERELQARVSELESTVNKEQQSKGVLQGALEAKVASMESLQGELFNLKEKLEHVSVRESQVTAELEKAAAEGIQLRESLSAKTNTDSSESETNKQELSILKSEKSALENEVQRLSKISEVLEYDLQEANNAMQVYITKEVSDEAKAYATQVLREQLNEIRKKADADRAAVAAEKEAKMALEAEVERLRADLYALVDVTDQENEMYGKHALTIKATDKIHRKERNEINELRKSLSRALEELRTSRTAERDAEERAAKAAHHVVVCEQELVAAKSDMRYLIQTMDEMRQDEASRRASLEHRIMTLENDHEVLQRFHATETDSLRNELTQAVMEKDRTLQLLKDAEKNNAAMLYAASRDHSARADESSETELAKLRIEKAQLLVAAAEEGARTERRIREVIATELSSAETDILVEREKRLAAEAAYDNMKLLVAELQNDVQAYRQESRLGRSPGKMMVEADNNRLKDELERALQEISSLRSQLIAAQSAVESANYRIERLTADLHVQQASSNRLGREMKFQTEFQQEMLRMRSTPQAVRENDDGEEKKEKREDEILTIVELYDKIHEQAEAQKQARECYLELKSAHEDLLSLLAQTEEQRQHLERALVEARGQAAVDAVNEKSDQSVIAQYGQRVRVKTP
ncbi:kinesin K39 [Seminavis robusta]|uniref:Kinesin K39 n=1 Tax=Seminavis robusta TaxID=568900 RepID=A0A9N8ECD7_9STRA|nr:kinesin K39 [Seminavis robusta]|eukprot:Sro874_g214280.1 kinesin K39 (1809) ;mRNA; r:36924-43208